MAPSGRSGPTASWCRTRTPGGPNMAERPPASPSSEPITCWRTTPHQPARRGRDLPPRAGPQVRVVCPPVRGPRAGRAPPAGEGQAEPPRLLPAGHLGGDRIRQLDEPPPGAAARSSARRPDLFPAWWWPTPPQGSCAPGRGPGCATPSRRTTPTPALAGATGTGPTGRPARPPPAPLPPACPPYGEAILQNAAALRRSSTVVHRQFSTYLNSYADLPVYLGPAHFYQHSRETCDLFPCVGHCSSDSALLPHLAGRPLGYHNSAFGGFEGAGRPRDEPPVTPGGRDRRQVLVARAVSSPYLPRPWGRISSLESEV
ncbi:hypothetical protein ANANG_G00297390 [Anguilla anguilla]|uniref:Uncharacterized protein n=1 Tax=Anguilla anguilla TaxID=7936 RepID=A0A9D3LML5_ANGAN|nr:hypothetical protein ANANG_G00297390 [Anguilla anguilla]